MLQASVIARSLHVHAHTVSRIGRLVRDPKRLGRRAASPGSVTMPSDNNRSSWKTIFNGRENMDAFSSDSAIAERHWEETSAYRCCYRRMAHTYDARHARHPSTASNIGTCLSKLGCEGLDHSAGAKRLILSIIGPRYTLVLNRQFGCCTSTAGTACALPQRQDSGPRKASSCPFIRWASASLLVTFRVSSLAPQR